MFAKTNAQSEGDFSKARSSKKWLAPVVTGLALAAITFSSTLGLQQGSSKIAKQDYETIYIAGDGNGNPGGG